MRGGEILSPPPGLSVRFQERTGLVPAASRSHISGVAGAFISVAGKGKTATVCEVTHCRYGKVGIPEGPRIGGGRGHLGQQGAECTAIPHTTRRDRGRGQGSRIAVRFPEGYGRCSSRSTGIDDHKAAPPSRNGSVHGWEEGEEQ